MKELEFRTIAKVYRYDELSEEHKMLIDKAKLSISMSYSPYSHFAVGAAVLLDNGEVFCGANQENAAYPSGLCAERTVMFYANANRPDVPVKALACACYTNGHFTARPGSPCGNCRQVLLETEHRFGRNMEILLYGEDGIYVFPSAKSLLPHCFVDDDLNG
ncbi:MAG: cytidine deaminase [Paludibacteraceae bacterium]|nr:cytidine deaminase [Paludibacteraceae bacterium]